MEIKYILLLDTSGKDSLFLGLAENNFCIDELVIKTKFRHSEKLIPSIEKLLKRNKIKLEDLSCIGAVKGPGPYTSLKIGLTVANVLSWGLDIPVFGIKKDEFENTKILAEKIYKQVKNNKKFKKIIEPVYDRPAYYE